MANYKYSGSALGASYLPNIKSPLDVRTVVNDKSTITVSEAYVGMLVFDTVDSNLYVCTAITSRPASITWKAISSSSQDELAELFGARIVSSFDELTSESLLFPYKGMFAVVSGSADKDGLYVLSTTPNTEASNWHFVVGNNVQEVIDSYVTYTTNTVNPDTISDGITLGIDDNAVIEEYVSPDYLYGDIEYSSYGLTDSNYDWIKIGNSTAGFQSYLEFYPVGSQYWLKIHISAEDNSLGLDINNITVDGQPYVNDALIPVGSLVKFGSDINMKNLYMNVYRSSDNYNNILNYTSTFSSLINLYKEMPLPVAYISVNGAAERVLTDADKSEIISDAKNTITVDVDMDGSESEYETESVSIQEFVTSITQEVNKIKTVTVAPEPITDEELGALFV